jgi:hypothetical protein
MSTRFMTNALIALMGGFVVVISLAFKPAATAWLAFAMGIGVLLILALAQSDRSRGIVQRLLDAGGAVLAVITIIFSLAFHGATVQWLSFAEALGFVGLAYSGLVVNEIAEWRAEHGLAPLHGLRVIQLLTDHQRTA